jgi:hypothetical protein
MWSKKELLWLSCLATTCAVMRLQESNWTHMSCGVCPVPCFLKMINWSQSWSSMVPYQSSVSSYSGLS